MMKVNFEQLSTPEKAKGSLMHIARFGQDTEQSKFKAVTTMTATCQIIEEILEIGWGTSGNDRC